MIHSMQTDLPNHSQAFLQMHTGSFQFVRPSLGAWTLYGLGSENENLPGFVVLSSGRGTSGGLDNAAITELVKKHLVRSERRAGATWYELAHDRLVTPECGAIVVGAHVVMGALVVTGEQVVLGAHVVIGALVVTGEQVVMGR